MRTLVCFASLVFFNSPAQSQSWSSLKNQPSAGVSQCLLLTDGAAICQSNNNWLKLTPDITGSYLNGTWSQIANLPSGYAPNSYASTVLADGRVVVAGGEYDGQGNFVLSNQVVVYDPASNTWTPLNPPSGWLYIGDAPAVMLATGQWLLGNKLDQRMALLDPATLTWTNINPTGKGDAFNAEEGWTLLADGTVLTVDVKNEPNTERFFPSTSTWVTAGNAPVLMDSPEEEGPITLPYGGTYVPPGDMGAAIQLANGSVFAIGGNGHTAIYTPPAAGSTAPGAWVQGPDIPNGLYQDDGPAAMLPNGHVLAAASPPNSDSGLSIFEFDGTNWIAEPANLNSSIDASNFTSLLLLPTGQVMLVDGTNVVQLYTSTGTYNTSWAPTISSVPAGLSSGSTYQIAGTQFNGFNQGSAFGDERQNATNYPLVRITNNSTGHVFYAKTHGHSTMGIATGNLPTTTNFDVSANTELGASHVSVVANGIPSTPVAVTINSSTPPPLTLACPATPTQVNLPYNSSLVASGGQPPYTFSLLTGSLPNGLMITPGTGAIAGTPTATGTFSFMARVTDSFQPTAGTQTASCAIMISPPPAGGFQGADTNTQGNWVGIYGQDGYIIANDTSSQPAYAGVSFSGASAYTWLGSTTDVRALLAAPTGTSRIASTYYASGTFSIDVNLTDGLTHKVALYLLDFDTTGRNETISILDSNTHNVLSTQNASGFHNGLYLVWNLTGHVLIQVANSGGLNGVMSGLFFSTPGSVALPTVSILAPTAAQSVSGTFTLSATASSTAGIASVQFVLDGTTNVGPPVTSGPPYSYAWNTVAASAGSHSLTAIATDTLSQTTTSAGISFTIAAQYLLTTSVSPTGGGSIAASPVSSNGYYPAATPVQLTATAASGCTFVNWTGALTGSVNPQTVTMSSAQAVTANFQCTAPSGVAFLTGYALSSPPVRNDFTGFVGMKLTVGPAPLAVSSVGRICVAGNSQSHTVKFVNASDGSDVAGASAQVNMAGCTSRQFVYSPATATLTAGASYYLVIQETSGADRWYDQGTVSSTHDAVVNSAVYFYTGNWYPAGGGNTSYVPPNFLYSTTQQVVLSTSVSPSGSGSVAASPASAGGLYNVGTPVQLTATAASGCTFSNWSGALTGSANPQTVTMSSSQSVTANFKCTAPTGTAFLTGYALNGPSLRNDFTGFVGMKLTVGSAPLAVSSVGRICAAGNGQVHAVKFVNASDGSDVAGASAQVNMAGCTAGQFVYASAGGTLAAGASYYLASQETAGGDRWYDQGTVSSTADAAVTSAVYFYSGNWYPVGGGNTSYVPPNFQFSTTQQVLLTTAVTPSGGGSIVASPGSASGNYNVGTPVQLTAIPASGCTFINWTGALSGSANPQTVTMSTAQAVTANFQCSAPASTTFLSAYALNSPFLRNDFTGYVGMKLTVGAAPLTVSSLGRICVAGNTQTHIVKFVNATNGSDVAGASASVNMAGCTAGQFVYSSVGTITLSAGATYYFVSQETQNGDRWYDQGAVTPASDAVVVSSVYFYNGNWYPIGSGNTSYVPPNFQYSH